MARIHDKLPKKDRTSILSVCSKPRNFQTSPLEGKAFDVIVALQPVPATVLANELNITARHALEILGALESVGKVYLKNGGWYAKEEEESDADS